MNDLDMQHYHQWLIKRSLKGLIYRRGYLYPKIWQRASGKILDIGCGIGDFVRLTKNAIGVDINPYNVAYCTQRGIPAYVHEVDNLPFDDETFDTVIFDNVIEHIYEPEKIILEAIRVTKIGGRVIIGVPVLHHFFHDKDHKVFYSDDYLRAHFHIASIRFSELFLTPKNKTLQKLFVHTCRWFVYERIAS